MMRICEYIAKLTGCTEGSVIMGRHNHLHNNSSPIVVVDNVSTLPLYKSESYDSNLERQKFITYISGEFTIHFMGDKAKDRCFHFLNMQNSQLSTELQRELEITVYNGINAKNIKKVEGKTFHPCWEVVLNAGWNEVYTIDTLRIDSTQILYEVNK